MANRKVKSNSQPPEETPVGSNENSGLITADELVPAIKEAADALISSEIDGFKASLRHQIELGKLLNQAKEACGHGHWLKWIEAKIEAKEIEFSLRTAQRCMRFASEEEALLGWAANAPDVALLAKGERLGVAAAEEYLDDLEEQREEEAAEAAAAKAKAETEAEIAKVEAEAAADITGGNWSQDKREQFVVKLLKLMPERVFHFLLLTFNSKQLADLLTDITLHRPEE
jgi:hypothetical protein